MRIPDHFVHVLSLPPAVKGLVTPNDDGTFTIYINALYDEETQRRTLEHELEHLAQDHFYKQEPIARQEAAAEGKLPPPAPKEERRIRLYPDLRALEGYLRSIGALDRPLEELGYPLL